MISSYASIYNLGHRAAQELFDGPVTIEEKVDGSQCSLGVFDGELKFRSKGQQLNVDEPEKMFALGVESAKSRQHLLVDGWTYRGEYLKSGKHNTLAYDRHPEGHIIIFDIMKGEEDYLSYAEKAAEAKRIGLEVVPLMYEGLVDSMDAVTAMLDNVSILGGQKIEGVVIKNYQKFGPDKKVLLGKYVSAEFKEIHGGEWKKANPMAKDIVAQIIEAHTTPARWNKAIQHLKEEGKLTDTVQDIGPLLKEIGTDVHKECADSIKESLFKWAWPQIARGVIKGFPEWYKEQVSVPMFKE